MDRCDFTGSVPLAAPGSSGSSQSYYYECATPGLSEFLSCSIPGHCAAGQKLEVKTSSTAKVFDAQGETLLHAKSLKQVMSLLGAPQMNRGYQTEAQAQHTLEVIWCLESHAPDSCTDWQASATAATCKADVHNLAGFVSRKKPSPDFAKARQYYDEALSFDPSHCPTLQYLTELNLQTSDTSGALATAEKLCTVCDATSAYGVQTVAALNAASVSLPAACAGGPSAAVLGGAIGGGVAILLIVGVAVVVVLRRRKGNDKVGKTGDKGAKGGKGKESFAAVSGGGLQVAATPPSMPPSPPSSDRLSTPYVV